MIIVPLTQDGHDGHDGDKPSHRLLVMTVLDTASLRAGSTNGPVLLPPLEEDSSRYSKSC